MIDLSKGGTRLVRICEGEKSRGKGTLVTVMLVFIKKASDSLCNATCNFRTKRSVTILRLVTHASCWVLGTTESTELAAACCCAVFFFTPSVRQAGQVLAPSASHRSTHG